MPINQPNSAALQLEAALNHLDIQPLKITQAELSANDAAILPALVDGEPVITPAQESRIEDGREDSNTATSPA